MVAASWRLATNAPSPTPPPARRANSTELRLRGGEGVMIDRVETAFPSRLRSGPVAGLRGGLFEKVLGIRDHGCLCMW